MVFLVLVWVVIEVIVAAMVADAIGILPTLFALALCSGLGVVVAIAAGRDAFARVSDRVARSRMPGDELIEGAVVLAGGALLVVPGFVSAGVGLFVLLPIVRAGVRNVIRRRIRLRLGLRREGGGPPGDVIDV